MCCVWVGGQVHDFNDTSGRNLQLLQCSQGGSRIFDWEGPRIDEARVAGQNVAIFALKSWPIGGGHGPVAPPLEPPLT